MYGIFWRKIIFIIGYSIDSLTKLVTNKFIKISFKIKQNKVWHNIKRQLYLNFLNFRNIRIIHIENDNVDVSDETSPVINMQCKINDVILRFVVLMRNNFWFETSTIWFLKILCVFFLFKNVKLKKLPFIIGIKLNTNWI